MSPDASPDSMPDALPEALPVEIGEFLVHLEKERDLSPNTLSAYRRDLREFSAYLAATHGIGGWDWNELSRTSRDVDSRSDRLRVSSRRCAASIAGCIATSGWR